jgi:hypothetical protein
MDVRHGDGGRRVAGSASGERGPGNRIGGVLMKGLDRGISGGDLGFVGFEVVTRSPSCCSTAQTLRPACPALLRPAWACVWLSCYAVANY